jgi:hypothetical protein
MMVVPLHWRGCGGWSRRPPGAIAGEQLQGMGGWGFQVGGGAAGAEGGAGRAGRAVHAHNRPAAVLASTWAVLRGGWPQPAGPIGDDSERGPRWGGADHGSTQNGTGVTVRVCSESWSREACPAH